MKKTIAVGIALLAVATMCRADELPALSLAGFTIGEKIDLKDAAVCSARKIESKGTSWYAGITNCYETASVSSHDGFELIGVVLDGGKVVSVNAYVPCKTKEEGIKKGDEILADYKKRFAGRVCLPGEDEKTGKYVLMVEKPDSQSGGTDVVITIYAKSFYDLLQPLMRPAPKKR